MSKDEQATGGPEDRMVMGENIREARVELGLSQSRLAELMRERGQAHWAQNTVSRVENGRQELGVSELVSLHKVLGGPLTTGTLLGELIEDLEDGSIFGHITVIHLRTAHEALIQSELVIRQIRQLHDPEYIDEG